MQIITLWEIHFVNLNLQRIFEKNPDFFEENRKKQEKSDKLLCHTLNFKFCECSDPVVDFMVLMFAWLGFIVCER